MSRRSARRGRPYQPMPPRRGGSWAARLVILAIGIFLVLGALALSVGQ